MNYFDELNVTVNKQKAKAYFERVEWVNIILPKVAVKIDSLLRQFSLSSGFDIKLSRNSFDCM